MFCCEKCHRREVSQSKYGLFHGKCVLQMLLIVTSQIELESFSNAWPYPYLPVPLVISCSREFCFVLQWLDFSMDVQQKQTQQHQQTTLSPASSIRDLLITKNGGQETTPEKVTQNPPQTGSLNGRTWSH